MNNKKIKILKKDTVTILANLYTRELNEEAIAKFRSCCLELSVFLELVSDYPYSLTSPISLTDAPQSLPVFTPLMFPQALINIL
jgi:hypothetical protein